MSDSQFVGVACGNYGPYTFHRGFKFVRTNGQPKVIKLGEFFFVRISDGHDPCIGELELLWHDRSNDQRLSSVRLYFLPEQTPEGRLSLHGEDEVLMASDKVVLRLDDLVCWITDQVDWNHGLLAICSDDVKPPPVVDPAESSTIPPVIPTTLPNGIKEHTSDSTTGCTLEQKENSLNSDGTKVVEADDSKAETQSNLQNDSKIDVPVAEVLSDPSALNDRQDENDILEEQGVIDQNELRVVILSYPNYCRYRTISKRVEGMANKWLKHALVIALGGFSHNGRNTYILFCRDSFEHEELAHHELNCEYLAPVLKGKKRRRKAKNARCTSPGSESNTSEEGKEVVLQNNINNHNGFKQPPCKNEQEFLQRLYNFMKKRKTPIHRVPHLGFKQIDLFVFFSFAQKLGGYDKITTKRLWKHVYDELGGDPGSTSAATCTRRHYEKLLLPFERFMDGREYKRKQSRKQKSPKKIKDENIENTAPDEKNDLAEEEEEEETNEKIEGDDAYTFTDSNHENSKDSINNEDLNSCEDLQYLNETFSDEDSKSIWSIQKPNDLKEDESEKDENKQIKPLIIQKEQNETFSEKERKWNEIRRKNALARKWVRQLRPSRGGKSSTSEDQNVTKQSSDHHTLSNSLNPDVNISQEKQAHSKITPPVLNSYVKPELITPEKSDSSITKECQERLAATDNVNLSYGENGYVLKSREAYTSNVKLDQKIKTEPFVTKDSLWPGYKKDNGYEISPEKYAYNKLYNMNMMQNYMYQEQKSIKREANTQRMLGHSSTLSECSSYIKSETDTSNDELKHNLPQRRPSVIQHTEYVTSPSPSQSPKQLGPENYENISRESMTSFGSSSNAPSTFKNQLSQNMAGKVSEWLAKGMPEAVACKTPSLVPTEKLGECHDKVTIPTVCKTPGPGSGKVPTYVSKAKSDAYILSNTQKHGKSKSHSSYKETLSDASKKVNHYLNHDVLKSSLAYPTAFHPVPSATNPLYSGFKPDMKVGIPSSSSDKSRQYSEPFYNQPKRHRSSVTPIPPSIPPLPPPRPSILPFARQQTYRKAPHSDIPKISPSSHTEYENSVLDLSVKKKVPEKHIPKPSQLVNSMAGPSNSDAVCLDLSMKKKPSVTLNRENAIENITPPITPSPKPVHHYSSFPSPRSSKPPSLIALQDMKKEDTRQKVSNIGNPSKSNGAVYNTSSAQSSIPLSSLAMSPNSIMFPGNAQNKLTSNFISSLPDPAFSKDMSKTLYLPPDPMHFAPYVIPPFYAANWTSANSVSSANLSNNSATSPNSFKETVSHGVFPKQYLYNYKNQFHPLLCKENGFYPPSCK